MPITIPVWQKDPTDILTIGLWWPDVIARGDTLAAVSWTVPTGLTKVSEGINATALVDSGKTYPIGQVSLVRLSGGTANTEYTVACTLTTGDGDVYERSVIVEVGNL